VTHFSSVLDDSTTWFLAIGVVGGASSVIVGSRY
jgi:hypothetical protein